MYSGKINRLIQDKCHELIDNEVHGIILSNIWFKLWHEVNPIMDIIHEVRETVKQEIYG